MLLRHSKQNEKGTKQKENKVINKHAAASTHACSTGHLLFLPKEVSPRSSRVTKCIIYDAVSKIQERDRREERGFAGDIPPSSSQN